MAPGVFPGWGPERLRAALTSAVSDCGGQRPFLPSGRMAESLPKPGAPPSPGGPSPGAARAAAGNLHLVMQRGHLDAIPVHPLPAPFAVRWFQPGDELLWRSIQVAADPAAVITPDLFDRYFGTDRSLLVPRQCFLLAEQGEVIGTATAWFEECWEGGNWGRIHWVAIRPPYQGRGLAKPLLTIVCQRLRELGHTRAFLRTEPWRLPAIQLYLSFGFVPWIRCAEEAAAWQGVSARLEAVACTRRGQSSVSRP